jgi:hypothetical protein
MVYRPWLQWVISCQHTHCWCCPCIGAQGRRIFKDFQVNPSTQKKHPRMASQTRVLAVAGTGGQPAEMTPLLRDVLVVDLLLRLEQTAILFL